MDTLRQRLQGVWLVHGSWGAAGGLVPHGRRIAEIAGDQVVVHDEPRSVTLPLQFASPCSLVWPDAVDPSRGYTADVLAIGEDRVVAEDLGPAVGLRIGNQLAVCINLFVVTSDGQRCWQWEHDPSVGRVDEWHVTGQVACTLEQHYFRFHYLDLMREEQSVELAVVDDLLLPIGGGFSDLFRTPNLAAARASLSGGAIGSAPARD